jgi:CRP/FNR family cyclic AMP-dependent transcriptional regulator
VLLAVQVALLGYETLAALARLPAVLVELNRRTLWRSRALAVQLALASEPHLDARLELLLWHLADRWGRREDGAVVLRLPLTCDLLAELAGAERSAVSRTISRLARTDILTRRDDGTLVLLNAMRVLGPDSRNDLECCRGNTEQPLTAAPATVSAAGF